VRVALSFDMEFPDRPSPGDSERLILAALDDAAVRATFFLQGRWARAYPDLARGIAQAGHLIGNHSHHHAPMNGLFDDAFCEDVRDAEVCIQQATGVDPRPWFRCPFGSGMNDARVLGLLAELGYRHVGWDVDPRDWEEGRAESELRKRVLGGVEERESSIVLMHGWPGVTARALAELLAALRSTRCDFMTVAELS
jgi:peptidoglycan/xylan/chitin deacetylase (PgdA/CDA1 family)